MELAKQAAIAAFDKKGSKIMIFDLRGLSDICDFQLICSGDNTRQTLAIAENINGRCRKMFGLAPLAIEGKQGGFWVLLDYGSLIIHIFSGALRDYYAIEELWPKAKVTTLSPSVQAANQASVQAAIHKTVSGKPETKPSSIRKEGAPVQKQAPKAQQVPAKKPQS